MSPEPASPPLRACPQYILVEDALPAAHHAALLQLLQQMRDDNIASGVCGQTEVAKQGDTHRRLLLPALAGLRVHADGRHKQRHG